MRALVEGLNIVSKHTKPNAANTQGGIVKQEAGFISPTSCWLMLKVMPPKLAES
jgi:hypothetical protein